MSLAEKVAIVTSAARGICADVTLKLGKEGAHVAITFMPPTVQPQRPYPLVAMDIYFSAHRTLRNAMHEMAKSVPAGGRMGPPDDIEDIVRFLATEDSRLVTANGDWAIM
ncbi:hypothetical protein ACJZ2D_012133 [Fusarium nematophilum]